MYRRKILTMTILVALLMFPLLHVTAQEQSAASAYSSQFSLRANLLRWATLTPNLGVEYRFSPKWAAVLNGSWTSWSWDDKQRRYALWEVAPEVRCYIYNKVYVGAQFKAGSFNYKLSDTGRQGDLTGVGITLGYETPIGKRLSLDFNAALGCLHADYEKYIVENGNRIRTSDNTKNWWGPTSLGITLIYTLN